MRNILTACLILISFASFAQRDIEEGAGWSLKDRIYVGGGFGLNGGTDYGGNKYFSVSVAPVIGYMITPVFSAGTGITYQYLSYSDINLGLHQYGLSPFLRYNVRQFFGQVEYNVISTPYIIETSQQGSFAVAERKAYDRLLLGIGLTQPVGDRLRVNVLAMYDVLYSNDRSKSPFASPFVFRFFFSY